MSERGQLFTQDPEYREALRRPFDPAQVGQLPKPTKKENPKGNCRECGGYHGLPALHLDFVSHANVTDRLNHAAPDWSYTVDRIAEANGHVTGVLGTMTIGGKSIQEVGAVSRAQDWGEEMKLAISDFIVRGAMRFGVALDLWIKGDAAKFEDVGAPLSSDEAEEAAIDESVPPASAPPQADPLTENAAKLARAGEQHQRVVTLYGGQKKSLEAAWEMFGISAKDLPVISMLSTEQAEQMIKAKGGL